MLTIKVNVLCKRDVIGLTYKITFPWVIDDALLDKYKMEFNNGWFHMKWIVHEKTMDEMSMYSYIYEMQDTQISISGKLLIFLIIYTLLE